MKHNFNAGPAVLPNIVKQKCIEAIQDFNNSGVSILEFGHRTNEIEKVVFDSETLCLELMGLSKDNYKVIFLQGGATTQFFQVPMNFLNKNKTAHYIDTGVWSSKALKAAKDFGNVNIIATSKDKNYSYIPNNFVIPQEGAYLHLTSNNTIYGTQWQEMPESNLPIVIDMCSDFLSREIDHSKFSFIYAGAQKNAGIAGCTIVVIKKDFLKNLNSNIPEMLQYTQHINNNSMLNTPPVFSIYATYLTLDWIKKQGGIKAMDKKNKEKAKLMYNTIDEIPIFKGNVEKNSRSMMNACFVTINEILEKEFLKICEESNIYGIKGHRSSGGFRASLYNALEIESVEYLCNIMKEFANKKG